MQFFCISYFLPLTCIHHEFLSHHIQDLFGPGTLGVPIAGGGRGEHSTGRLHFGIQPYGFLRCVDPFGSSPAAGPVYGEKGTI